MATNKSSSRQRYNKIAKELKHLLQTLKNGGIRNYLQELTPTEATDYSLWKATRKIKQPQHQTPPVRINRNTWARTEKQKATAFAKHPASVLQPLPSQLSALEEETIKNALNAPHQKTLPMKKIRIDEVKNVIKHEIHPKKAPGYDLITRRVLQELSQKGLLAITQIYNAILRIEYFPCRWKIGQIIIIAKPGKNSDDIASYRPISLLPILSKILKKILLQRLTPIIEETKLIPSQQFGFRKKHATIEQAHRIVDKIYDDLEKKTLLLSGLYRYKPSLRQSLAHRPILQTKTCIPTPGIHDTEVVSH